MFLSVSLISNSIYNIKNIYINNLYYNIYRKFILINKKVRGFFKFIIG